MTLATNSGEAIGAPVNSTELSRTEDAPSLRDLNPELKTGPEMPMGEGNGQDSLAMRESVTSRLDFAEKALPVTPPAPPPFVQRVPTGSSDLLFHPIPLTPTKSRQGRHRRHKRAQSWQHLKLTGTLQSSSADELLKRDQALDTRRRPTPTAFTWTAPSEAQSSLPDTSSISDISFLSSISSGDEMADVEQAVDMQGFFRNRPNASATAVSHEPPSSRRATRRKTSSSPDSRRFVSRYGKPIRLLCLVSCLYVSLFSMPPGSPRPATTEDLGAFDSQHGREVDIPSLYSSFQQTPVLQRVHSPKQHTLPQQETFAQTNKRRPQLAYARASSRSTPILGAASVSGDTPGDFSQQQLQMTRFVLNDEELAHDTVLTFRASDNAQHDPLWCRLAWVVVAGLLLEVAYRELVGRCCRTATTMSTITSRHRSE